MLQRPVQAGTGNRLSPCQLVSKGRRIASLRIVWATPWIWSLTELQSKSRASLGHIAKVTFRHSSPHVWKPHAYFKWSRGSCKGLGGRVEAARVKARTQLRVKRPVRAVPLLLPQQEKTAEGHHGRTRFGRLEGKSLWTSDGYLYILTSALGIHTRDTRIRVRVDEPMPSCCSWVTPRTHGTSSRRWEPV